jgi:transposase
MEVMIGVDPHKGSHTAVAIDQAERVLAEVRVSAGGRQGAQLLKWAAQFEQRTWAIESASGLGYLLAQQLLSAHERVLNVPATFAARVRLLATGSSNKNDPNDAYSVAVAALRAPALAAVPAEDHATILRMLAKRNLDLVRARTRTCCRLHAVLSELVAGGISKEMAASRAAELLRRVRPVTAVETERKRIAQELLADLRRLDRQAKEVKARIATALAASGTTLTEIFGVGPVVAAMVIGCTGDIARFQTRDRYAAYNGTAPIGCPRVGGCATASRGGATAG